MTHRIERPRTASPSGYAVFDTAIGRCGIAWSDDAIVQVQLPCADDAALRARLLRDWPAAVERRPNALALAAIDGVVALLRGEARTLQEIPLDLSHVPPFDRQVYERTRAIPPGQTRTYGEIAHAIGEPGAARAVGRALGRNPFAPVVPCHRVLAAGGGSGGFSATGGVVTKMKMLAIEGARVNHTPELFGGD